MEKILIAVPCMDQMPVPFVQSLVLLEKPPGCTLFMKCGSLIHAARNEIALNAMEQEYDFVFWMDSDMVMKSDTLIRMMQTMKEKDLDILTGLYFRRVPPYTPVIFDKIEIKGDMCEWSDFKEIPKELFKVGACGFGCVLMKTDVFFDVQGRFGQMFTPIGMNGEDIAFCWRARQCGFDIWCDPSVICGHVSYSVIDDKFFKIFSEKGFKNGYAVTNDKDGTSAHD